jgi:hypothetical protein
METDPTFNLVKGAKAYAIWFEYNQGDTEYLDAMFTVERNLELVMGLSGQVYAQRSQLPYPYSLMFRQSGSWEYTEDAEVLGKEDRFRLEVICRNFDVN